MEENQHNYENAGAQGAPMEHPKSFQKQEKPYMFSSLRDPHGTFALRHYLPPWKDEALRRSEFGKCIARLKAELKSWESSGKNDVITHVSMASGNYCIKDENEEEFIKNYSISVLAGNSLFLVERPTTLIRYFLDLDFKQPEVICERDMEACARVVQQVVRTFFTSDDTHVIVCTSQSKSIGDLKKSGIHMLWPSIFLLPSHAQIIRESILCELMKTFGKRAEPNNSWEDVVDNSVYGNMVKERSGSGLRMIGSRKTVACKGSCGGVPFSRRKNKDDKSQCESCLGTGKMDEGRPYFPLCVLTQDGKRHYEKEDAYIADFSAVIRDTKIRTRLKETPAELGFKIPDGAPLPEAATKKRTAVHSATTAVELKGSRHLNNIDPVWDAVQTTLANHCGELYKSLQVNKITTNAKSSFYKVTVTGQNCRYCQNISREHSSNRIYFIIEPEGVSQRCYDDADIATAEMKYGLCSTYKSGVMRLPHTIVSVLFPTNKILDSGPVETSEDNEEEDTETVDPTVKLLRNPKLKSLLDAGDAISQDLFGVLYSTSFLAHAGKNYIRLQTALIGSRGKIEQMYSMDPSALGSRATRALKELGFDISEREEEATTTLQKVTTTSLSNLESSVYKRLKYLVDIACHMDAEEAASLLEQSRSMEFLKPAAQQKLAGSKRVRDLTDQYAGK